MLAVTAECVYRLHPADEWPNGGGIASASTQMFLLLVQHVRYIAGDTQMVPGAVERMTRADRAALLDDALGLWAIYGPKYPGLPRGPDADAAGLADLMPGGEPNGDGPGTAIDVSGLTHPASGGLPAEGIGPAPRPAAPGRSARRPVLHAGRTALGKIATSSEGVAGRTTAAPAPVIARATMNEVRLVDQAAHHRIADEDQQALDERTTAAVPVACRVEHEHRRGVGNGAAVDDPVEVTTARPQVLGHVGAATISDVFAMATIGRLRQRTSRVRRRRGQGSVIYSTGVFAKSGIVRVLGRR
ncbi:hypothetical protein AQJ64_16370 [Streptomyces griseoruber]|uniref:Uncharacterized protein n=1 Tax=Streptomyces griseoruber TaxID=1943 RepID=A0A117RCZ0_9ACTN|nr:hypothetical protein AQJ64_16370 [Streptomyces griseoruber]